MRIAVAELKQESNTFSPFATTRAGFEAEGYVVRGRELTARLAGTNTELGGALEVLAAAGHEAVPALAAWSLSGGPLTAEAHAALRGELLDAVEAAAPFDALLLVLHGSLVAEGCDDVEGDLLARLRAQHGPALPIVISLDMHACFTQTMLDAADACAVYHTNPHTDFADTGRRAARLLLRVLAGERFAPCVLRFPWLTPPETSADSDEPMRGLLARVRQLEAEPGIAAAAFLPGQPWLDVADLGASVFVLADSQARARAAALELGAACWAKRFELDTALTPVAEAIALARQTPGLTVFSDCADSTTSGSAGDSTYVLNALLEAGFERPALVLVVDPAAAAEAAAHLAAHAAAPLRLPVGGRLDPVHNQPLWIEGIVERAGEFEFQMTGQSFSGLTVKTGLAAVVACGAIRVLLTSRRVLTVDPALYRCAGLEPAEAAIVLVKSPIMYRANYRALAARMVTIDAPGASPSDVTRLAFRKLRRPCFPWDRALELKLEDHLLFRKDAAAHANG